MQQQQQHIDAEASESSLSGHTAHLPSSPTRFWRTKIRRPEGGQAHEKASLLLYKTNFLPAPYGDFLLTFCVRTRANFLSSPKSRGVRSPFSSLLFITSLSSPSVSHFPLPPSAIGTSLTPVLFHSITICHRCSRTLHRLRDPVSLRGLARSRSLSLRRFGGGEESLFFLLSSSFLERSRILFFSSCPSLFHRVDEHVLGRHFPPLASLE